MRVINDLYDYEQYKIVQDNGAFKFSLDSILLAEFVEQLKPTDKVLDLCTGNGVVPLILSYYYKNKIVGFEIQSDIAEMALLSIENNHVEEQIKVINDDVKNIKNYFPGNNFDVIVANPPYFRYKDSSLINKNINKAVARHEINLKLEEVFETIKYALKENGVFYLVHLPERLDDILYYSQKYKITAKVVQFIYTNPIKDATIVLVKCVNNAKNSVVVRKPVFVNECKSYKNIFKKDR